MELELCNDPQTDSPIHFYEVRCYWLSNFSAFGVTYLGNYFATSEHAYQASKFPQRTALFNEVQAATSAHEAMIIARNHKDRQSSDWDDHKRAVMKEICRSKLEQHPYIQKKLVATGSREIIEVSPVDSFWGWGPNKDGRNELGKIWMELRAESANQ